MKVESRRRKSILKTSRAGKQTGLCFVSRTLGLRNIDGCRSQPVQARKKSRNGGEANGWGKEQAGRVGWAGGAEPRRRWADGSGGAGAEGRGGGGDLVVGNRGNPK